MRMGGEQWRSATVVAAILAGLLSAPTDAAAARDTTSTVKRILILGDSLSEGFLLRRDQAWPMLLVDKLRGAHLDYEVVNASQSGGTTAGGLIRLGPQLKKRV